MESPISFVFRDCAESPVTQPFTVGHVRLAAVGCESACELRLLDLREKARDQVGRAPHCSFCSCISLD
jgi:hypothetical protein